MGDRITRRKFLEISGGGSVAIMAGASSRSVALAASDEERIEELIRKMTLEEKVGRMSSPAARDFPEGIIYQIYIPGIPRLGIPPLPLQIACAAWPRTSRG